MGTGTPVPNGLFVDEATDLLTGLCSDPGPPPWTWWRSTRRWTRATPWPRPRWASWNPSGPSCGPADRVAMETPPHVADRVILVRPTGFGHDAETAASNAFQRNVQDADIQFKAESEFDELLGMLDRVGVGVTVLDPPVPDAPMRCSQTTGSAPMRTAPWCLYPMATPSRRRERDRDLDETLERHGFKVRQLVDLTALELDDRYLEGTGSLVIDRPRNVAFAALSPAPPNGPEPLVRRPARRAGALPRHHGRYLAGAPCTTPTWS